IRGTILEGIMGKAKTYHGMELPLYHEGHWGMQKLQ
ncbi:unnamed protein product, partial [marine sediment metagenome]